MVYVGMDVHRKRTQVAVIDERGEELSNRNSRNDPAELSPILMTLEPGTPVVFEAAYGWGGSPSRSSSWVWRLTSPTPRVARRSPPRVSRTTRSMPAHSPTFCAPICCPRPGWRLGRSAISACSCATQPGWCATGPHSRSGSMQCSPTRVFR
jgi:hypothetical protein